MDGTRTSSGRWDVATITASGKQCKLPGQWLTHLLTFSIKHFLVLWNSLWLGQFGQYSD